MRLLFTFILFCVTLGVSAQSGVSVKTVTVPGSLHDQFQGESLERIRILKIKGVLNKEDMKFLSTELRLQDLDMTDVNFDSSVGKEGLLPGYQFERMKESLQYIKLPSSVRYLADGAFEGMLRLKHVGVKGEILSVGKNAFKGCGELTLKGDEFLAAEVVEDYAFFGCASITEIRFGAKLTKLGTKVFQGCSSLRSVEIDPLNEELLFIPEGAFAGCSSLERVDIPNLIKSIDKTAFSGCVSLSEMNLRTLVPPLLNDKAFDEVHPMTVYVNPKSMSFYKRSGTWRRFRNYFMEAGSRTLYVREKPKPTPKEEPVVSVPGMGDAVADVTPTKTEKPEAPVKEEPKGGETETNPDLRPWPEVPDETVSYPNQPAANPVKTDEEPQSASAPGVVEGEKVESKPEETVSERSGLKLPEAPIVKPTYFNSEIVNPAVPSLTFYIKSGLVHIEAPVKIKQITIIDQKGRSIFATRVSDTLYTTAISQAEMKLIRAVYENGVETKRFR